MDIKKLEERLNELASDLILLDANDEGELKEFFNNLESLKSECDDSLSVLKSIIDSGNKIILEQKEKGQDNLNEALTCLMSTLQSVVKDYSRQKDISQGLDVFNKEIQIFVGGSEGEEIVTELTDAQLEVLPDFISEARRLIEEIECDLIDLEKVGIDLEKINNVFRAFHTFKGESNMLNLINLGKLAHKAEDILEKLRSQDIELNDDITSGLLNVVDTIKGYLEVLSTDVPQAQAIDLSAECSELENIGSATPDDETSEDKSNDQILDSNQIDGSDDLVFPTSESGESEKVFIAKVPELDLADGADIYEQFLAESFDHLENIEDAITGLKGKSNDKQSVELVHRSIHTIKGLASFLELDDICALSQYTEILIEKIMSGSIDCQGKVIDSLYETSECMKKLLTSLEEQINNAGKLNSQYCDIGYQIMQLKSLVANDKGAPEEKAKPLGEILIDEGDISSDELEEAVKAQKNVKDKRKIGEILQEQNSISSKSLKKGLGIQKGLIESTIRINIEKLDSLIDLVGELVINESQVIQNPTIKNFDDQKLVKDIAELDRITRRLQEVAMGMRLVPVKPTFQKMLRLIRDLSKRKKKDIDVILSGEDTEIDKNMVELLSDPLIHMVRNSVDHGIESQDERLGKGKSQTGHIELSAYHKGSNVVVEISDDGAGLNKENIQRIAIERGLIKDNDVVPDNRLYNMIFEPGFSTAETITDVSGRGVGMDVVKKNIEKLRGKIDVKTEKDQGSTFSIQLPITLAIIEGIIVLVAKQRYILPISSVIEFVNPSSKLLNSIVNEGQVYSVQDKIYPVIYLDKFLNVQSSVDVFEKKTICLIDSDYGKACLVVDELLGQQQVVIKSLGDKCKHIKCVSGGAILGDGRVGLILDVNGIMSCSSREAALV